MRKLLVRMLTLISVGAATLTVGAPAAYATCHRFNVQVSDDRVFEGETVTVTVSRIGPSADSSVVVSAVGDTATAGDFSSLEERVGFVGSEREKTVEVQIVDDTEREATEQFFVRLSAPQGCAGGPAFVLPGDVPVIIIANDQTPAPPPPEPEEPPAPSPEPEPAEPPEEEPEPAESPNEEPEPSPSPEEEAAASEGGDGTAEPEEADGQGDLQAAEEEEDIPTVPWWVFLALGGAVLLTALFVYLQLGRAHSPPPPSA